MPEGPQLSDLPKRKASTILPRRPSPPLNKLPSSQPIIPTSIPPSQGTLRLWEPFTLERYTSETDPNEHLKVYITHVTFYTSHDAVFYKAFPTTLKVPALECFTTFPPYSINYFDILSHMFTPHFVGSRSYQTTTISLLGVRHEQDEALRAFIDRFMHGTHSQTRPLLQQRLTPPTRLHARIEAPRRRLYLLGRDANSRYQILQRLYTLCRNPPTHPSRPDPRPREPRQPRFTRYTPLNVPRSRHLNEALQADLIPPPRKTTTPPNVDMTKYCRYHRNNGHTTEECKALQGKIEELVRADHFCCFIRREDHPP
ncbi:uncharacterized protein LOC114165284 [Vigna unguiculata]|uniref:uncharacterized protein LOC114165284 n=1 Tax=Vigna unguiculata TaxID=3917 RepID=UPI0010171DE8|nr:uncharacterized protein LOC114165284 [Vigna unguiculata]